MSTVPNVLGIFPSFAPGEFGGVQASGREAWDGMVGHVGPGRAQALCYEPESSKAEAVFRALRIRSCPDIILIWHLHLLKLLPFIQHSGARVVLFLHGVEVWRKHNSVVRSLLRRTHLLVTNSEYTWSRFLASNPEMAGARHQVVHLGAGSPLDAESVRPSGTPAALMIGRLRRNEDYKGHREMIQAWPLVIAREPKAELWIVGGGDAAPDLERLARDRGVGHCVRFFGQVSDAEKERLIAQSRCLALPSAGEGFGLVYLEAMRMGRPCLVSDVDAGREVVGPPVGGLAADPRDAGELADCVLRLMTAGEEWDSWSRGARERYERGFTASHFRERLVRAVFGHGWTRMDTDAGAACDSFCR
jgi:phosphatidyl-myo-inositol dimannoside synthase